MPDEQAPHVSISDIVARLERSRRSLMEAIAGLDEEGFRARAQHGGWTAAETLSHLLSTERIILERAQAALTQEGYRVISQTEDERQEGARLAQRMPVPQIVHGLLAQRRDVVTLLEPLSPRQLSRPYRQESRGELTVGWLFQHIAEHEEEHAEQIRAQLAVRQA